MKSEPNEQLKMLAGEPHDMEAATETFQMNTEFYNDNILQYNITWFVTIWTEVDEFDHFECFLCKRSEQHLRSHMDYLHNERLIFGFRTKDLVRVLFEVIQRSFPETSPHIAILWINSHFF